MTAYWCRFLDRRGRVYASEKLVARNDAEAVAKVRALPDDGERVAFELWDGARRVAVEEVEDNERAPC